jgi:hypothetical protein
MTSKVLELESILEPDRLATRITEKWQEWDSMRNNKKNDWEEIRRYVYATDTTQTTNSSLPWKNKTTVPKLCQIRDNLYSNYTATLFPQRKNVIWEANEKDAASVAKRDAITNYMLWTMEQPRFKHEMDKIILDYIDFGNCFATVEWMDERVEQKDGTQAGYVGPCVRRINPLDIVMNPTTEDFLSSPKIVRSILSKGEVKKMLESMSNDQNRVEFEALWEYMKELRRSAADSAADWTQRDNLYAMEGFTSFRDYLQGDYIEVLTFYGDIYDQDTDTFIENHVITVVDRHKLIGKKPNPSFFGYPPIFHVPWRKRQDNLWGMGPLDNLVGMQYRLDHIENMKADIFDLVTYPVQKVKGFVEDFTWQPGEKIYVSEEGDVELISPEVNVNQIDMQLQALELKMEEMAGAPREAMGFRTPGEKTKYEVQRLENASGRLFQNKIKQFDEQMVERLLNAKLELARRNMVSTTTIKVFDNEFNLASFQALTVEDITGIGRIKPVGARHFAEQAELIQNLTNLTGSGLWPFVQPHFSSVKLAQIVAKTFNLDDWEVVSPFVNISEQADAQRQAQALHEQVTQEGATATGIGQDFDINPAAQIPQGPPPGAKPQQAK